MYRGEYSFFHRISVLQNQLRTALLAHFILGIAGPIVEEHMRSHRRICRTAPELEVRLDKHALVCDYVFKSTFHSAFSFLEFRIIFGGDRPETDIILEGSPRS